MSCERAIELMIDALVEPLDKQRQEELDRHVAACDSCAAELAGYRVLWQRLETVAIPNLTPGALERLQKEVRNEFGGELASAGRETRPVVAAPAGWLRQAAATVVLVGFGALLAGGLGHYFGSADSPPTDDRARYLVIMTETTEGPELAAQAKNEFREWIDGLIEQGIMESGFGLADRPPIGAPPDGTLLDAPVTGFIVIRAAGDREARRIVAASPLIRYGGFIEIRAID